VLETLARVSVELAHGAGELAYGGRRADFEIATKSTESDLVTEVDRRVERWIADQLAERRPGDGLMGEEGASVAATTGVRWIVDPIDGTVNFALGLPHYAVSVAAQLDGTVVAGCVYNPESGETYRARLGGGAFLDRAGGSTRLRGPREVPLSRAVIATGFSYAAHVRARQAVVLRGLIEQIADVRRIGAASLDLCAVAAGRVDGYFEAGLHPWDRAAGLLIAGEAGCVQSGLRGRQPGDELTCVAGPGLAGQLIALLERLDADKVL
jgi:myo-inositol-1(or 4)-monophosphatase